MAEELSDGEIDELRRALTDLESALRRALADSSDSSKPVDLDEPIGRLSRMEAIQQKEMASANRTTRQARLRQVAAALARVADGEYGLCVACEEPIGLRRLRARPESPLCLSCQSARE